MVMKRIIFIIATAAVSGIVACCSKVTSDADIEQASGFSLNILMPQTKTVFNGQTYEENYDKLLISTGASPVRPPLPAYSPAGR